MRERDLELGRLQSRPARDSEETEADNKQSSASSETLETNGYERAYLSTERLWTIPEKDGSTEDEEFVKLPRRRVEQLIGLWIDVLQQGSGTSLQPKELLPVLSESSFKSYRSTPSSLHGRYPPILRMRDEQPWCNVDRMTAEEIRAEDEYRKSGRMEWKPTDEMGYLEDSWKHLWEPLQGVDKGLFQFPGTPRQRKQLQLELADALTSNDRIVAVNMYMRRDYRAISTLISLIGLRLNEQYRSYVRIPEIGPITQIMILIECIWACNAFDPSTRTGGGYREGPRLSNVLSSCYRRGVLNRPERGFDDYVTTRYFQRQCQYVRRALHLVNLLQKRRIATYLPIESIKDAQAMWDSPLPDVEAATTLPLVHKPPELREGSDVFLRIDDFNLRDLQMLGHLQIQWTSYWEEHLQLETSSTANILKIFWFQPKLGRYLVENHLTPYQSSSSLTEREDELYRTWCLLFTSKCSPRLALLRYKALKAPRWLSLLAHNRLSTWTASQTTNDSPDASPLLSRLLPSSSLKTFSFEPSDHLLLQWSKDGKLPHERVSYSQFPVYGDKLRELRQYMDSQQPTGLRALWKDRRNSNTYYTFWFVVIFGSLSVFLAAGALGVGIAQTWAAFKAIGK